MNDSFGLLEYTQDEYELSDPKAWGWVADLEDRAEILRDTR